MTAVPRKPDLAALAQKHHPVTDDPKWADYNKCWADNTAWPCDAAQLAEALTHAEQRTRDLRAQVERSAEGLHDYALLDPDVGMEHASTPWTICEADECREARAAIEGLDG